jgi:hypothetical protein
MLRKNKIALITIILVLALAPAAFAALQVGPLDPLSIWPQAPAGTPTGFPSYYMDAGGTAIALLPITGDGVNAPTQIYFPPDPANPYSAFLGFESEAFYYFARCVFSTKYGKATATFGLESSFVNGVAKAGEEMVFARIRLKAPVRDVGTYTFTHPWGSETIVVTQADIDAKKAISFTRDVGLVPRDFLAAANGPIQVFSKQLVPAPPAGWVGDGASVGTMTPGSNALAVDGFGNAIVKLTGPVGIDLDGKKNNFVQSNQFTLSGRVLGALPSALSVQRATCSEVGTQEYIDVFATSDATAIVKVQDPAVIPIAVALTGNGAGKFYGHVLSTGAHGTGPFPITVTAETPGAALTSITVNVVDNVNISKATYSPAAGSLSVIAKSSDNAALLTLKDFNLAVANDGLTPTSVSPLTVPPPTVTVTSSMGGSGTTPVVVVLP